MGLVRVAPMVATFIIVRDAHITSPGESTNYGGTETLVLGQLATGRPPVQGPEHRALAYFDTSLLPTGSTGVTATLDGECVVASDAPALGAIIYPLTKAWAENTVTWNNPWTNPGGDFTSNPPAAPTFSMPVATGYVSYDISSIVQWWADGNTNHGLLLIYTGSGYRQAEFNSREHDEYPGSVPFSIAASFTPPLDPVTVAEAKAFARIDTSADDALIGELITTAREYAEHVTGRQLMTSWWDYTLDAFPETIAVPLSPLAAVTWIKYTDTDGIQQTLPTSDYQVDTTGEPGRVAPAYGESWPTTRDDYPAVTVRFQAGYGAAADVPDGIKDAMKLMVAHWYEDRESVSAFERVERVPVAAHMLLKQHAIGHDDGITADISTGL